MKKNYISLNRLDVCELVDRPLCKNVINLKWLWKNKRDEENTVIRNKSRLVAKRYAQKEGINFKRHLQPVARLEAVRLFICEEVYVNNPDGLLTQYLPDKVTVYKKALMVSNKHQERGGDKIFSSDQPKAGQHLNVFSRKRVSGLYLRAGAQVLW
ncbi:gag-pol polyprotein [Tanacetum coccineum]